MELAAAHNIKYLGFSLLSADIFRGPRSLVQVAGLAVEVLSDVGAAYPSLKEVHLIAHNPTERQALLDVVDGRTSPRGMMSLKDSIPPSGPTTTAPAVLSQPPPPDQRRPPPAKRRQRGL